MIEWLDLSGIGPHLARLRRRLDSLPDQQFSELSPIRKLGRSALTLGVLVVLIAPCIWLISR